MTFRLGSAGLALWFLLQSVYAQEPTCANGTVSVGILDSRGDVPPDLNVGAFVAQSDRRRLEITAARPDSGPKRVAILIDTSASMRKDVSVSGKMNLAYWAASDAIKRLPANVSIAVVGFSKEVDRKLDFSVPREKLASEIADREKSADTSPRGRTALLDAIEYVLGHIPNAGPGDVIYAITDGEDNHSHIKTSVLQTRLEATGVRLHLFLLQDFLFTGDPFPGSDDTMTLARATGGVVINVHPKISGTGVSGTTENFAVAPKQKQIMSDELTLLYRQTATPYLLDLKMPANFGKAYKWKLNVADQYRQKSTYLFYPREIVPCHKAPDKTER
jgi:hypothetical protein